MNNLGGLLSSVSDAVWVVDLSTKKFLYVNERLADICEKPLKELKEDPKIWLKQIHPDDVANVKKETSKISKDRAIEVEHRIITSKGVKWVINKQILTYDSETKAENLIGIVTDITRQKEAELKLSESEKTYHYLFLHNPNPLFIYDLETLKFLDVNIAAITHYGYSEEEFLSMTILDIRPEEDVPEVIKRVRTQKTTQHTSRYWRHFKKDKSIIYTTNTGYEISYKGRKAEIVVIHDVTNEVKTREEITLSKNNLDALINTTDDLIWSIDRNYCFMYTNESFLKTYEMFFNRKIKPGDRFFVEDADVLKEHWLESYDRALAGELVFFMDRAKLPNGYEVTAEVKIHPIYNGDKIIGVGCFSRDITQHVENEKKILGQNEQLKEIAALASHEIRGPVTSIMGLVNLFNYQNPSDPFNGKIITHLKETAENLDTAIHQVVAKTAEFEYKESIRETSKAQEE